MGRKITLGISALITAIGALASAPVHAGGLPRTQWTYAEMAELNEWVQPKIAEYCQDDNTPMCHDMYIGTYSEFNQFRALAQYRNHGFTITAIDPYNHTIRVAFDTYVLSAGWVNEQFHVKDLYIAQPELGAYAGGFATYVDNRDDAALEHLAILFTKNDARDDEAWIPYGSELEISTPNLSIDDAYTKELSVFYRVSTTNAQWGDYFNFSDCLSSLEEGMECQIRYEVGRYTYVPVEVEKPVSVIDAMANTIVETVVDDALAARVDNTSSANNGDGNGYGSTDAPSTESAWTTSSASAAGTTTKTPDTGASGNYEAKSVEFPWWLGTIFVAGIATLSWLFWPRNRQKSQNPKK